MAVACPPRGQAPAPGVPEGRAGAGVPVPLETQSAQVQVAHGLTDLLDIAQRPNMPWPPPNTHVLLGPALGDLWPLPGAPNPLIVSDAGPLPTHGFWWTTLGELYLDVPGWVARIGARVLEAYIGSEPQFPGEVTAIPVVYRADLGANMRWIKTTFRGELGGGVEQFQFGINLGNPGNDPDLAESAAPALAEQLAAMVISSFTLPNVGNQPIGLMDSLSSDVVFTEVGVTQCTITQATAKDGTGGNLEQAYETAWFAYPVPSRPTGSGAAALPYEVATAITLQTDHRGPSGRGRIYLPPFTTGAMSAQGLYNPLYARGAAQCVGKLFDAIEENTPYLPVIVSKRRLILNRVTSVNVGMVPDSQRRRRRSQDEARLTEWLAAE